MTIRPHNGTISDMEREIRDLRAALTTERALRGQVERERAAVCKERDAAVAANAALRAAASVAHEHACKMAEFHGQRCDEHDRHDEAPDDCLRCAADTAFGLAFADLNALLKKGGG